MSDSLIDIAATLVRGAHLARPSVISRLSIDRALEESEERGKVLATRIKNEHDRMVKELRELRELRAVLSALGAVKGPDGWTVPGCECGHACAKSPVCEACGKPERIPVPLAALEEGEPRHE